MSRRPCPGPVAGSWGRGGGRRREPEESLSSPKVTKLGS